MNNSKGKRYCRIKLLYMPCFHNQRIHWMEAIYEVTTFEIGHKGQKIWRWELVFGTTKDLGNASAQDIKKYCGKRIILSEWTE